MKVHVRDWTRTAKARRLPLPSCPICHDLLFAPTASALVNARNVRHVWACESCGYHFITSVRLRTSRRREAPSLS